MDADLSDIELACRSLFSLSNNCVWECFSSNVACLCTVCRINPTACSGQDQDPSDETIVATSVNTCLTKHRTHGSPSLRTFGSLDFLLQEPQGSLQCHPEVEQVSCCRHVDVVDWLQITQTCALQGVRTIERPSGWPFGPLHGSASWIHLLKFWWLATWDFSNLVQAPLAPWWLLLSICNLQSHHKKSTWTWVLDMAPPSHCTRNSTPNDLHLAHAFCCSYCDAAIFSHPEWWYCTYSFEDLLSCERHQHTYTEELLWCRSPDHQVDII